MMSTTRILLCFLCASLLDYGQANPVPYRQLSKRELRKIALDCINEVKIDRIVVEKAMNTQILPADDKKYKNFLACSYKKQGFLTPDGRRMVYENLDLFLQKFYTKTELRALDRCKSIRKNDPGELCFENLACILETLRNIERGQMEDIESNYVE